MAKEQKVQWHLNPAEVKWGEQGFAQSRRKKLRQSRHHDQRSLTLVLEHTPTGITVEHTIPPGHYARKEMQKLRERLYKELFQELEHRVANALRIPGR